MSRSPVRELLERAPDTEPGQRETASSLARMLAVLDLYTADRSAWTVEQIAGRLDCSISTAYRYVKTLTQSQLLAPAAGGTYILGGRIIQLDRQIRRSDPLIEAARRGMAELAISLNENLILSSLYGDAVICIHEEWADRTITMSYLRGLTVPLFRGAVSKVILANLPVYQQRRLMLNHPGEIARAGLGSNWASFKIKLKEIRRAGYCVAIGEVDPELTGIAVPLFGADGQVVASLCIVIPVARDVGKSLSGLLEPLQETARIINKTLAE